MCNSRKPQTMAAALCRWDECVCRWGVRMEEEQHKCREREGSLKVMTSPSLTPPHPANDPFEERKYVDVFFWNCSGAHGAHMMEQLLVLSLLKEEVRSSALLGK